jgi:hypothetical protein
LGQKRHFSADFFGENISKIITSVPGRWLSRKRKKQERAMISHREGISQQTEDAHWTPTPRPRVPLRHDQLILINKVVD